jgi:hypothetical protein
MTCLLALAALAALTLDAKKSQLKVGFFYTAA